MVQKEKYQTLLKTENSFGYSSNQSDTVRAKALFSSIYDVHNHFFLDIEVDNFRANETNVAKKNIEQALKIVDKSKLLITFDRGYPSLEFFNWLINRDIKFLMRVKTSDYEKEKREMITDDEFVKLIHNKHRVKQIKDTYPEYHEEFKEQKETMVRFTKVKLNEENMEHLVSNLSLEEFNSQELKELYGNRWNIETSYNTIKNKLKIESFTGNLPQFILQDVYAQTVVYNQIQDMIYHANRKLEVTNNKKNLKHKYQINENKAIGLFKEKFIKIMLMASNKEYEIEYDQLIEDMTNFVSIIRKNRGSNPRKWSIVNKYKPNMKFSF
ncbi:MAG: transposase [Endomicrobium sp.]|jgi:hypothetical protein|nr:transposase [Endomicrobium sp.]